MRVKQTSNTKHNLPSPEYFVGREQEIERIKKELKTFAWIISIDGIGGIGKTALAKHIAHLILNDDDLDFGGIVWVSAKTTSLSASGIESQLPQLSSVEDLFHEIFKVAGLKEFFGESLEQRQYRIKELLRTSPKPYLFIIDNLDTVSDIKIRKFLEFLREYDSGGAKAIVTSRKSASSGESVIELKGLLDHEAKELINYEITKDPRLNFLQSVSTKNLEDIIHGCAGLPLAIKWILAKLKNTKPDIQDVIKDLNNHQNDLIKYIFSSILQTLSPLAKNVLSSLPAFQSNFSQLMLEDVFQQVPGSTNIIESLQELRSHYLIELDECNFNFHSRDIRYKILPPTRICILTLWEEKPDLGTKYLKKTTEFYQKFWKKFLKNSIASKLEDDYENTKYLLEWSFDNGHWSSVIELASFLEPYVRTRGLLYDRLIIAHKGYQSASFEENRKLAMKFKETTGKVYKQKGDYTEAERIFTECASFYRKTKQLYDEIIIKMQLGILSEHKALYFINLPINKSKQVSNLLKEALAHYTEANKYFYQISDKEGEAKTLHLMGRVYRELAKYEISKKCFNRSIQLKKANNNVVGEAISNHELARLKHLQGSFDEASLLFQNAITILMNHGALKDAANAKWQYSQLLMQLKQYDKAKDFLEDAIEVYREQGRWIKMNCASSDLEKLNLLILKKLKISKRTQHQHLNTIEPMDKLLPGTVDPHLSSKLINIKIFVSYSSKDRELRELVVEGIKEHLTYRTKINYTFWSDKEIDLGANWKEEIEKTMKESNVAILLVTSSFVSSQFIQKVELAEFFKRKAKDGYLILPILVRNYDFSEFEMLSSLNFFKTYYNEYGYNKPTVRNKLIPFDVLGENEDTTDKQLQDYYFKLADHIHKAVSNHFE
jgi:hypothetical protein